MENEEVLFEGQATYSKENISDYVLTCLIKKRIWQLLFPPLAFLAIGLVLMLIQGGDLVIYGVVLIACGAFIVSLYFFQYQNSVKVLYTRACEENNGKEPTNIVKIFNTEIILLNTLTANKFTYSISTIKKLYESKNLIFLVSQSKLSIIIEKSKIVLGNKDELIKFVKSKVQA